LEIEVRDRDAVKTQFLGYTSMTLKSLNKEPKGERWLALGARPGKDDKPGQGDVCIRWNFTRTVPLRSVKSVAQEELWAAQAELAALPSRRVLRAQDRHDWERLSSVDKLRLIMNKHPATTQSLYDAFTWKAPALLIVAAVVELLWALFLSWLDVPVLGWLFVMAAFGFLLWYWFDLIEYKPERNKRLSEARAEQAKQLEADAALAKQREGWSEKQRAEADAKAAADKTAQEAAAAAELADPIVQARKTKEALAKARAELASRQRAHQLAAETHATDTAAALVVATVVLLRSAVLGALGAAFRPRLHVRAAVVGALAAFAGLCLSQFVPSFLIAWFFMLALLLVPGFVNRGLSADAVLKATKTKKKD
jgi:hypothetical protein